MLILLAELVIEATITVETVRYFVADSRALTEEVKDYRAAISSTVRPVISEMSLIE